MQPDDYETGERVVACLVLAALAVIVLALRRMAAGFSYEVLCQRCGGKGCDAGDRLMAKQHLGQYLAEQFDKIGEPASTALARQRSRPARVEGVDYPRPMEKAPAAACDGRGKRRVDGLPPLTFPQDLGEQDYG